VHNSLEANESLVKAKRLVPPARQVLRPLSRAWLQRGLGYLYLYVYLYINIYIYMNIYICMYVRVNPTLSLPTRQVLRPRFEGVVAEALMLTQLPSRPPVCIVYTIQHW